MICRIQISEVAIFMLAFISKYSIGKLVVSNGSFIYIAYAK